MAEVSAVEVKTLRERTGLPMMDCKKALQEAGGNLELAVELLRKGGAKVMEKRAGKAVSAGRIAVFADPDAAAGAMVELRCESAPVAANREFAQLADDLAKQLAVGPGASEAEELLAQPSPRNPAITLREQFDDLLNRIREMFKVERIVRLEGRCAGYAHHNAAAGVLLRYEGGNGELARDICMHIAALRPQVIHKEDLDPAAVDKEREILAAQARQEGKPENIIQKMIEGRLRDFYAKHCLAEQQIANEMKYGKKTVGQAAKEAGLKLLSFVHWELPKES